MLGQTGWRRSSGRLSNFFWVRILGWCISSRIRGIRNCGRGNAPASSLRLTCCAIFAPMEHLIGSARAWRRIRRGSQGRSAYPVVVQAAPMDEHTPGRRKKAHVGVRVFWRIGSAPMPYTPIRSSFVRNCLIIVRTCFGGLCERGEVCQKSSNLATKIARILS